MRSRIIEYFVQEINLNLAVYLLLRGIILYLMSVFAVIYFFVKRSNISSLSTVHTIGIRVVAIISGVIGLRLFHIIKHLERFKNDPADWLSCSGGSASWGALQAA